MKERFEELELELITFGASDVIATSGNNENNNGGDDNDLDND